MAGLGQLFHCTHQVTCFCGTHITVINTVLILTMAKNKHPYQYFESLLLLFMLRTHIACPKYTIKIVLAFDFSSAILELNFCFCEAGGCEVQLKY